MAKQPPGPSSDPVDHPNHPDDHRAAAAPLGTDAETGAQPDERPVKSRPDAGGTPPKPRTYGPG